MYYYILEEYKVSNELLTEDIYVRYAPISPVPTMTTNNKYLGVLTYRADGWWPSIAPAPKQALQAAVQRIEAYVHTLEDKLEAAARRK